MNNFDVIPKDMGILLDLLKVWYYKKGNNLQTEYLEYEVLI